MERRLPDHVGLEPPGHPDTGRALDDRGPLPRPEGGRGRPGLRRQREVRRRVAAGQAGHRRGARDGDGPRGAQGVLRRPGHAVLHRVREVLHRPALPGEARRGGRRAAHRGQVPDGIGPRLHRRGGGERGVQDRPHRRAHGRAGRAQRLPGSPVRRGGCRPVEPGARRRRPAAVPARRRRRDRPGADAALRHPRRCRRRPAPRGPGPTHRRSPRHHGVRPAARAVRRRP